MTEKAKRKRNQVRLPILTLEQLDYMSKACGVSRQQFIEQLITKIFEIAVCFKSFKMTFTTSILDCTVEISIHGDSVYKIGEFKVKSK